MLQLLKSSFWSFLSVLVRAVSSLTINKLFALYYGPNGITLFAHFQNLIAIITTVPNGGVNIGAISLLATDKPDSIRYRRYFMAALFLNLLCFVAALACILGFPDYFLGVFLRSVALPGVWQWSLLFGLGSLLLTLNLYLLSVLLARQELRSYVLGVSAISLAGLAAVYLTSGKWALHELLLLILGAQGAIFFVLLPVLYRKRLLPSFSHVAVPARVYLDLWKYIVMALSAVVCLKLTDFYIRDYVIGRYDLYQTGLWQAVVRVSEQYSNVYTAVVGMLVYPRMAALAKVPEQLRKFVRLTFYLVLPLLAVALLLVYLLRDWVLLLLFSEDFLKAEYLFDFQLLGDFFRMWSVMLTNLLVVQAQVRLYVGWQVCSAVLYIALVYLLIGPFGLEGIQIAHTLRYAVVLVFFMLYYTKYIRP
ncbi:hypothetical protein MKJ04_10360 [Pontibacter sp. E15-1]|uniref:hypothetical protein n=1 Tax=Pontibacter sp. E15-1 TaxID=2919918 RepID=UPI001F4FF347|nr:hypothetical protein [Pontibacter sp. E15-1]MCJ8165246.1 hypothetical protein [Pontibacter sp. E15-1]